MQPVPLYARVSDLIKALPQVLPDVELFDFCVYQTRASMLDEADLMALPLAATVRRPDPKSAWDRIEEKPFAKHELPNVIELALRHSTDHTATSMRRDRVSRGEFLDLVPVLGETSVVAMMTRCTLRGDGEVRHLPMLDFRCQPDEYFVEGLKIALRKITRGGGAIVHSGKSLHFYGFDLLNEHEWRTFMYRALLLAPLTDARYVAHRLLDGFADLRLTSSSNKPSVPNVLAYIE